MSLSGHVKIVVNLIEDDEPLELRFRTDLVASSSGPRNKVSFENNKMEISRALDLELPGAFFSPLSGPPPAMHDKSSWNLEP